VRHTHNILHVCTGTAETKKTELNRRGLSALVCFICLAKKLERLKSSSAVEWLACLPLDTTLVDSNPIEGDGFLRGIKIRSPPSFRGEVKPSTPCFIFCDMLKNLSTYESYTSLGKIHNFVSQFLRLWYQMTAGRNVRELWWPCRYDSTMVLQAHMSLGGWTVGPFLAAVQRRILISTHRRDYHRASYRGF
jgi:hypothetical protein